MTTEGDQVIDLTLNAGEQGMLERCEATIARGLDTFVEVGEALMEVRERRLYRSFGTFEDYCRERWRMSASRARQMIGAAQTVTNVTLSGLPQPASEAVARELRSLTMVFALVAFLVITTVLVAVFVDAFRGGRS